MKIYYAHSKIQYGSGVEASDLARLHAYYPTGLVIDPNKDIGERGAIQPYLDVVRQCDRVYVRCIDEEEPYFIGKGVFSEVAYALAYGKQVFLLIGNDGDAVPVCGLKITDTKDWKRKYGILIPV